jgi:hypothetical protein
MSGSRGVTEQALRAVSMKLAGIPGSFPLIVDPVHASFTEAPGSGPPRSSAPGCAST